MRQSQVIHEQIRFGNEDRLAGILSYPAAGTPTHAVLICSPHPNFGGDLENNVVAALAEAFAAQAVTLRFDYRGVGQSRIELPPGLSVFDYWENIELTLDYSEPLADATAAANTLSQLSMGLPLVAVGYSFGACMCTCIGVQDDRVVAMVGISPPLKRVAFAHLMDCPKPCLLVSGRDDFVYDAVVAENLLNLSGGLITFEQPAADHFFIGLEGELVNGVARFIRRSCALVRAEGANGRE